MKVIGALGTVCRLVVAVLLILLPGCSPDKAPGPATSPPISSDLPRENPADVNRRNLAELTALRAIDSCGFVDPQGVAANVPGFRSYSYGVYESGWLSYGYYEAHQTRGFEECTLRLTDDRPIPKAPLKLIVELDEEGHRPTPLGPTAFIVDGVDVRWCGATDAPCFTIEIPTSRMEGAPTGMRSPRLTIVGLRGSSLAPDKMIEVRWMATMVARRLAQGIPIRGEHSPSRLAQQDPCASIADVPGKPELKWREPPDEAAELTSWRLPYHCTILRWADSPNVDPKNPDPTNVIDVNFGFRRPDPGPGAEFLKKQLDGLNAWVDVSPGEPGSCHYFVQAGPVVAGKTATGTSDAPEDQRIPVVEVRTYSPPCELAESVAVKAAKRALS